MGRQLDYIMGPYLACGSQPRLRHRCQLASALSRIYNLNTPWAKGEELVSKDDFRGAMSKFATGVTVVTTLDHEDQLHGMTANSFTSVCLEPAVLLVCVAHSTHTYGYVESRGSFGVNICSTEQQAVAQYFARRPEDRKEDVPFRWSTSSSGVPVLDGSLISFVCRVIGSHVYGDHTVYIAEVEELRIGDSADPLLFYESRWNTSVKRSP